MEGGIAAVREILARIVDRHRLPIDERRAGLDAFGNAAALPGETRVERTSLGGVPAERLWAEGARSESAILVLHGGAFVAGSARSHRRLSATFAAGVGCAAYTLDYRRAPEAPFPAALDDAVAAYEALCRDGAASGVALVGDSAGGGLVMSTAVEIRHRALLPPRALVCISPWVDLLCDSESHVTRADRDPFLTTRGLLADAAMYLDTVPARNARASPLFADLSGLPPLLVQVGDAEILLDDATRLAERFRAAGGDVTLEVWPEMIHVWHAFADQLVEAREALERVCGFLTQALASDGVPR